MFEESPIFLAALAGFVFGNAFCWLPGPINLTILNEGAQRGFRWAFAIGLGAVVMDAIYCAIAFAGFSQFFDHGIVKATMQVASFVFLLFLGFKFLLAKTVRVHTKLGDASEKLEEKIEKKIHPHSAFMTGFIRVAANLGVLAAWLVIAATLMAHDWVADTYLAKAACVGGVFAGALIWFTFFSFIMSRGHGKFSEKTLLRLQHISGLCLVGTAVFEGVRIAWRLAQHKL
jgi:threonine/homoserine/homoserine lactone efflux protein